MSDEALVSRICDKDAFLNDEIDNGAIFAVIKAWQIEGKLEPQISETYL